MLHQVGTFWDFLQRTLVKLPISPGVDGSSGYCAIDYVGSPSSGFCQMTFVCFLRGMEIKQNLIDIH